MRWFSLIILSFIDWRMISINENTIHKARRFLMFNLSIFDCRTEGEKELYAEL